MCYFSNTYCMPASVPSQIGSSHVFQSHCIRNAKWRILKDRENKKHRKVLQSQSEIGKHCLLILNGIPYSKNKMKAIILDIRTGSSPFYINLVNCFIVFINKRTVMNGTSPRQIPMHIIMSLANKYSCNLEYFIWSCYPLRERRCSRVVKTPDRKAVGLNPCSGSNGLLALSGGGLT